MMNFLNGYDFITPTNPEAAVFFGIIFTVVVAVGIWMETREVKTPAVAFAAGCVVTVIGVSILNMIGFYG
jgi:riboflavin transporter FmnP